MMTRRAMQIDEVATIERQKCSSIATRECQNLRVLDTSVTLPSLLDGEHVMTEPSKFDDDQKIEVLVSIDPRHPSGVLVLADDLIDLVAIFPVV
jgi:hypothetical protein